LTPRKGTPEPALLPFAQEPILLTVGELSRRIQRELAGLGKLSIKGEVSRVASAASGHLYFDLKDEQARVACIVWRSQRARALGFELSEGMQVIAHGELDLYAPRGSFSLVVQRLEQAGLGALLAQLEARKRELKERGWFDRARELPELPRVIGVVTSRDGAAFADFLRTRSLRWPLYPVRLAHTPVQGPGAAESIAEALFALDRSGVDVIVLCRGGGSLEDLWAFNELAVAEAIWRCRVPVVCGVGHETDVTLADFVADRRAHTPTDAAQLVIPDRSAYRERLERAQSHLLRAIDGVIGQRSKRLERLSASRPLRSAAWILVERSKALAALRRRIELACKRHSSLGKMRLESLTRRLVHQSPVLRLERVHARCQRSALSLRSLLQASLDRRGARVELTGRTLEAISPLRVLERGYSITTRIDPARMGTIGEVVRDSAGLAPGERLSTRVARGCFEAEVVSVVPAPEGACR
jgi:exodeoxyribonuclease VII large subunit